MTSLPPAVYVLARAWGHASTDRTVRGVEIGVRDKPVSIEELRDGIAVVKVGAAKVAQDPFLGEVPRLVGGAPVECPVVSDR
jgi:hypothetical protein